MCNLNSVGPLMDPFVAQKSEAHHCYLLSIYLQWAVSHQTMSWKGHKPWWLRINRALEENQDLFNMETVSSGADSAHY